MKTVTWSEVIARYRPGSPLAPLAGSSTLVVDSVDDQRLCVRQRLWVSCLTRTELETAVTVLAESRPGSALELAEMLRVHYATGFHVTTECSRVPNLSAMVLADMGVFRGEAGG